MPGIKPKVGPKKRITPKPKRFPEKRGVKAPPKAKAKPPRMRSGGAVKKKPVKKGKGGPMIGSEMGNRLSPYITQTALDDSLLNHSQFANLTTAMDTLGKNREYEKGSTEVGPRISQQLYDQIASAMGVKGKVPMEKIYPMGPEPEPEGKARGGAVTKPRRKKPVKKAKGGPASVNFDLMKREHGLNRRDLQQIGEDYSAAKSKKTGTGKYKPQKIAGSKSQSELATKLKSVDPTVFGQMFPGGTVTIEEIYPPQKKARGGSVTKQEKTKRLPSSGTSRKTSSSTSTKQTSSVRPTNPASKSKYTAVGRDEEGNLLPSRPIKKARGGPVKKMRGGPVKKMRGGPVKKMRSGGAVGCGAAKRGYGAVKRGR